MVDMNALERQLADESLRIVGPEPIVDDAAIFTAITATQSPRWRFQTMFSTTRFVAAAAIVALFGGLLLAGVLAMPREEQAPAVGASASPPVEPTEGPGSFSPAGSLADTRGAGYDAVPLLDGRVLIVGGYLEGSFLRSVAATEVWDPETAMFSLAGTLGEGREGASTTRLPDGRVLVVGGYVRPLGRTDSYFSGEAQVWDPATESFHAAGSLEDAREGHTATLLPDGRVLIVGGWGDGPIASAELWDPETLAFGPAGSLNDARGYGHTAILLSDGRVLVVGGEGRTAPIASAEVWDPDTMSFSRAGALAETTPDTATLLQDGRVLFIGGGQPGDPDVEGGYGDDRRAEIWDPETMSFGPGGSLAEGRQGHTATLLPDGRVLVIGGELEGVRPGQIAQPAPARVDAIEAQLATPAPTPEPTPGAIVISDITASVEVWDPATETFGPVDSLAEARTGHLATLLTDGRVLVIGGLHQAGDVHSRTAELWDPGTETFGPAGTLVEIWRAHTATLLPDGRVLVIGPTATGGGSGPGPLIAEVWSP